ncbi:hypothetical protein B9Z39_09615 [Limnohabitans sp. JirII-29]|nr:hypothetical protein B9Z39_09615 [Limnohabitans sp. JirII-29]
MEKYVVTQIKSSDIRKKPKVSTPKSTPNRGPRRTVPLEDDLQDAAYTEAHRPAQPDRSAAGATPRLSHLVARGKDLVSGDATSVATAAAIVVGAALIEVELIPGLIIGAGAVLLSKFFPEMGDYVRPAIKGAIRAGFAMTQKAREVMAETSEQVHDLVAEVMLEEKHPQATQKTPPKPASAAVPKA